MTGVFKNPITFSEVSESSATFNMTKYSSVVSDSDEDVSLMEKSNNSKETVYILLPKGTTVKELKTTNMPYLNIYRPPMMLREGNVFIGVCLSFCWWGGVSCDHYPWYIGPQDPPSPDPPLQIWEPPASDIWCHYWRTVQTCLLEDPPPPTHTVLTSGGHWSMYGFGKWALCLLECFLVYSSVGKNFNMIKSLLAGLRYFNAGQKYTLPWTVINYSVPTSYNVESPFTHFLLFENTVFKSNNTDKFVPHDAILAKGTRCLVTNTRTRVAERPSFYQRRYIQKRTAEFVPVLIP